MESTIDIIKQYYDAFNNQDMNKFFDLLSEDVIHDVNQGGRHKGKEPFSKFMEHMNSCYKESVKELIIMVNGDGSHAAAEFIIEGTYLATDKGLPPAKGQ